MALSLAGNTPEAVNASCGGITHPTSAFVERSYGTIARAKDSEGNVVAALLGKESLSFSVTGYSTESDGPSLGDEITVGGEGGKVTNVTIERSNEDFSRFTADGRGLPA